MTPSQRQLIKEAYQAGYYGALNEAPSRTTLRFLKRLAAKVAKEMNLEKQGFTLNRKGNIIDPVTGKEVKGSKYMGNVLKRRSEILRKSKKGLFDPKNPDLDTPIDDAIDALKKRLDDADDIDLDEPIG